MKMIRLVILFLLMVMAWGCKSVDIQEVDAAKKRYNPEVYREFVYVYPDIEPTASEIWKTNKFGYMHVVEMYPNTWYPVTGDTLLVYAQHQTEENTNFIYPLAITADLVVMCFPENNSHLKHIIPNSKGVIFTGEYTGGSRFLVFAENSLDYLPSRLIKSKVFAIGILIKMGRLKPSSS